MTNKSLELTGSYVDTNLKDFGQSLINLINISSQVSSVELKTLKFKTGVLLQNYNDLSMKQIISNKIPIFDYLIYNSLDKQIQKEINWIQDSSRKLYTETQISYSVLFVYFMVVTRNKAMIGINENIPEFLIRFMKVKMNAEEIANVISTNDLNLFSHFWVKDIDIKSLSVALKNRLKKGISGMRLFSIFKDYQISSKTSEKNKLICEKLKKLAVNGPFWEMHNLFQPESLSSLSLNANLLNLILLCYDDETIKTMVSNRSLFKYPLYNSRAHQYENWDDTFFLSFTTKVFND